MSLNIRDRDCLIYVYFFCVYRSEMSCKHLNVPPIHECKYARYVYMNPDVEFQCVKKVKKVSKIVFNEILVMFGINFTTKTEFFLQGSDTN